MKTLGHPFGILSSMLCVLLLTVLSSAHAAFKCQGADGKIEYSDRQCDKSKSTLHDPNAQKSNQVKPVANPMEQLRKIFSDFEPRLCERELLAAELDRASRAGEITKAPAVWRGKQDQLIELNDVMIDFQIRAGKITKPAGNDSAENAALRKFQASLKNCPQRSTQLSSTTSAAPTPTAAAASPAKQATK